MRWSEVAPRGWRLGRLGAGHARAPTRTRCASRSTRCSRTRSKYTEPDDAIELRARARRRRRSLIEVADEGRGIPADALERIFERFAPRRPGARPAPTGGVGLGLAIVDAIARAHGGDCSARNGAAGAVFTLRFPAYVPSKARASAFQAGPAVPS